MGSYHRILGISEGASKEEIKRSFRKLAMRYHPDVNDSPDAAARFLLLKEAYEGLMEGRSERIASRKTVEKPKEQEKANRRHPSDPYRPAVDPSARYKRRKDQLAKEGAEYYKKYKASVNRKLSTVAALASIALAVLLILDFSLPKNEERHFIKDKYFERKASPSPNQINYRYYFNYANGEEQEVAVDLYHAFNRKEYIVVYHTPLFSQFLAAEQIVRGYSLTLEVDSTLRSFLPFYLIILLLPILRYFIDRPHVSFYFYEFSIRTANVVLIIVILLQLFA